MPGGWAADYEVKNIKEVREKLQVLKEWKNEDIGNLVLRKYRVKEGQNIPAREGYIGNLKTGESTRIKQWEFIEWWDESRYTEILEEIGKTVLK